MNKRDLVQELKIRYGKDLYLGYHKNSLYHFLYGYKRILIELVKSLVYLFQSVKNQEIDDSLAMFSTDNQLKALRNAKEAGIHNATLSHLNTLSFNSAFLRIIVWCIKFCVYPLSFVLSQDKQGVYMFMLPNLMNLYCKLIVNFLISEDIEKVYISNDHAGDIFIVSILLRDIPKISVSYVQHGAVKEEFPINFFDEVFVYDRRYVNTYRKLSQNPLVKIYVREEIDRSKFSERLIKLDVLICLSHEFKFLEIYRCLKLIRNENLVVGIRFHPSDRFTSFKYFMLKLYHKKLVLSDSDISYIDDFNRSNMILSASSSLLIDAFLNGFSNKLVWVKSFGQHWDYYDLEDKVKTIDSFLGRSNLLTQK